jgi:preprotein translocase subunit SecG
MQQIIFLIHVLSAICLIALVLMQHGKGADAGASFGSGASQTMFGSVGSMPFLIKVTALVGVIFFISSLSLGVLIAKQAKQSNVLPTQLTSQVPGNK